MQLHAVVVAPSSVADAALASARQLVPSSPIVAEVAKSGLLDRLRGRRRAEPPAAPAVTLSLSDPDAVFVRLAKFGNVTLEDATGLARALEVVAQSWRSPVLHVTRVVVAEADPHVVTAQLEGDVDSLRAIYDNVNEAARLQRFFLDRRSFRSELTLGSVEPEEGASVPDSVAGAEVALTGDSWAPTHITLLRASRGQGGTSYAEVARIALSQDAHGAEARTVS